MKPIILRMITGDDDFSEIEKLQQNVWGIDALTTVPSHVLQASCKYNAGFLAGAFHEGVIVGLLFALNTRDSKVQYLHMIGVDPEWQGGKRGFSVGEALNEFHRSKVLQQGVEFVEWTFDPLLTNNATLNFHKLGVKVVYYEPDAYGKSSEVGIYEGMPTDRVLVRWSLKSNPAADKNVCGVECFASVSDPSEINGESFKMEVPFDIQVLKQENMELACASRLHSREIFLKAMEEGYNVKDFICLKDKRKNYYIFSRY